MVKDAVSGALIQKDARSEMQLNAVAFDDVRVRAKMVAAGACFTCAVRTDGGVTCWGSNYQGQSALPPGW